MKILRYEVNDAFIQITAMKTDAGTTHVNRLLISNNDCISPDIKGTTSFIQTMFISKRKPKVGV